MSTALNWIFQNKREREREREKSVLNWTSGSGTSRASSGLGMPARARAARARRIQTFILVRIGALWFLARSLLLFILIWSLQVSVENNDTVRTLVRLSTLDHRYWSEKTKNPPFRSMYFLCWDVWPGQYNKYQVLLSFFNTTVDKAGQHIALAATPPYSEN